MNRPSRQLFALGALFCAAAFVNAQTTPAPAPPASRGQLLYNTHCISCHTTQMHWRSASLAYDWESLKGQVRRWQGNAGLGWNDADIAEVARHLNETIYHHPQTADRVSSLGALAHRAVNTKGER